MITAQDSKEADAIVAQQDELEERITLHNEGLSLKSLAAAACNPQSVSAQMAKQMRQIEALEFACQRAVNFIDSGMSRDARKVLLEAIGAPERTIQGE